MINLTKEIVEDDLGGVSLRLPKKFHSVIKAEAALENTTKDEFFRALLILGAEIYNKSPSKMKEIIGSN